MADEAAAPAPTREMIFTALEKLEKDKPDVFRRVLRLLGFHVDAAPEIAHPATDGTWESIVILRWSIGRLVTVVTDHVETMYQLEITPENGSHPPVVLDLAATPDLAFLVLVTDPQIVTGDYYSLTIRVHPSEPLPGIPYTITHVQAA